MRARVYATGNRGAAANGAHRSVGARDDNVRPARLFQGVEVDQILPCCLAVAEVGDALHKSGNVRLHKTYFDRRKRMSAMSCGSARVSFAAARAAGGGVSKIKPPHRPTSIGV